MTTLTGSEKQVAWADEIIKSWNESFDRLISEAQARVDRQSMPQAWVDHVTAGVAEIRANLSKITKAHDIIEMKKRHNVPNAVQAKIEATYKS